MSKTFHDGLQNIATGLGDPDKDKVAGLSWSTPKEYTDSLWSNMYRDSWVARRIVDAPAEDATRNWREWQADYEQISKIEALENRDNVNIAENLTLAMKDARGLGKGFVYFHVNDDDPSEPINLNRVRKDSLQFAQYVEKPSIIDGDIQDDPMLPGYGYPAWYEVHSQSEGPQFIHPSRLIKLRGDERLGRGIFGRKADSVLRAAKATIEQHDATMANIAALVFEAKVDVWTIPGLRQILSDPAEEEAFLKAAQTSNYLKGVHGLLMLEGGEAENKTQYDQKKMSFATLPDIIEKMQDQVCAAAKFSRAYLYGSGKEGLGGSGDRDLKIDYDKVEQIQKTKLQPAMVTFDEVLIRSALGNRPEEIHYNWRSLWQESDNDKAERISKLAASFKSIADADMWPPDVLTDTSINTMIETGGMPGLEAAWIDWQESNPDGEDFASDDEEDVE